MNEGEELQIPLPEHEMVVQAAEAVAGNQLVVGMRLGVMLVLGHMVKRGLIKPNDVLDLHHTDLDSVIHTHELRANDKGFHLGPKQ